MKKGLEMEPRPRVLFLCTHNAARSQMAEGILRDLSHGTIEVFSAGSEPTGVHPLAIRALQGMGIDITGQRSKHVDEFADARLAHGDDLLEHRVGENILGRDRLTRSGMEARRSRACRGELGRTSLS